MSKIGSLKLDGGKLTGRLRTLKVEASITVEKIEGPRRDNDPSHRVLSNGVELGAAWTKHRDNGPDFLSITIDDPSFDAPMNIAAFPVDGQPGEFDIVFNRPRKAAA
jgi:uncharacterized protein (DUF736 family)